MHTCKTGHPPVKQSPPNLQFLDQGSLPTFTFPLSLLITPQTLSSLAFFLLFTSHKHTQKVGVYILGWSRLEQVSQRRHRELYCMRNCGSFKDFLKKKKAHTHIHFMPQKIPTGIAVSYPLLKIMGMSSTFHVHRKLDCFDLDKESSKKLNRTKQKLDISFVGKL